MEDDEDAFQGVGGQFSDKLIYVTGGVGDVGAEDEVGGLGLGVFPGRFDEVDVLDVVVAGFFKEGLGHGGGGFDGGDVFASEGEGEGQTAGAGADVDEGVAGLYL